MAMSEKFSQYGRFAHEVAPFDGPYNYVDLVSRQSYQVGLRTGLAVTAVMLAVGGIAQLVIANVKVKKKLQETISNAKQEMQKHMEPVTSQAEETASKYYSNPAPAEG